MTAMPVAFDQILLWLGNKQLWGSIAAGIGFAATLPYIRSVWKGATRPHIITWLIWGIATTVIFAAQWVDDGGAGSWATGIGGVLAFFIAGLAWYRGGDQSVRPREWYLLAVVLVALPLWYVSEDALLAVALITMIDLIAYLPTFRKSYHKPHEERIFLFAVMLLRNLFSLYALEHYSATTMLFPALTGMANVVLIAMILACRRRDAAIMSVSAERYQLDK